MIKKQGKKHDKNIDFEPLIVILFTLLKTLSPNQKIDIVTKEKIIRSLDSAGYSQLEIASIIGASATDVNRAVKGIKNG